MNDGTNVHFAEFSRDRISGKEISKNIILEHIVCLVPLYFGKTDSRVWKVIVEVLRTFKCSRKLKFKNYGFKH